MPHLSDQNGIKPAQNKMKSEYLFTHLVQFLVNALHRKPHHIVVTSLQSRASDIAYPFLDAISSCLVERLVFRHVIFDFLFRERLEGYLCSHGELVLLLDGGQTDTRDDMVGLATQHAEHPLGIFRILGFPRMMPLPSLSFCSSSVGAMTTVSAVRIKMPSANKPR